MNEAAARLIERIETNLKVTDGPGMEILFTMDRDAAKAFAEHLRVTDQLLTEYERLRNAIAAIQKATVEGRVCDDVAWFDGITTLHDFCDEVLNPPNLQYQQQAEK